MDYLLSLLYMFISFCVVFGLELKNCSTDIFYDSQGLPMIAETVLNCSYSMNSAYLSPAAFNGYGPVNVTAQLVLNNLVEINEVQKTFFLDIKFRLTWLDPRYSLPALFELLSPYYQKNGINILYMTRDQVNPVRIWLPDVHFSDAQEISVIAEELEIKNHGVIYWSRHLSLVISQSTFSYRKFPLDTQNLQIRFESYSSPVTLFNLQFSNVTYVSYPGKDPLVLSPPVQLYQSESSAEPNFKQNPLWLYDDQYTVEVKEPNYSSNPLVPRIFSQAVVSLHTIRQNQGFLLRFGLPITGVTCVGGLLFWDTMATRLSNTITLMLTVASLFIAIFGAIPLVGYATVMDIFVFTMFAILLVRFDRIGSPLYKIILHFITILSIFIHYDYE
jgi:hypothetical protein